MSGLVLDIALKACMIPVVNYRVLEPLIEGYPYRVKYIQTFFFFIFPYVACYSREAVTVRCRSYRPELEMAPISASNGPKDLGPRVSIVVWLLIGLSSVFIALRVFCKFKTHRGLWWDDHILIISWVCTPILSPFTSSWLTHREAASARRQLSHHRLGTAGLRKAHLGHRPGQSRSTRLAGQCLGQPIHPGGRPEQDIVRCNSHLHHRRLHQSSNLDRRCCNEQLHVVVGAFSVYPVQPAPQDLGSLRTRDVLEPVCRDRI